ncbi:PspC domain-containing protein [Actinokineospora enzanensis]|uniref:PspC domain-containing protein n=1 Tax=Actinokineospora enzanensis TaxID=155975 RepID=UPI0003614125|nr:PspC domain-containing protein [Actinokineospora enzanensis]
MTNNVYEEARTTARKLRRSRSDRMVAGVCGGLARTFGVDTPVIRIILVAATLLGVGTGALVYLACWILMPEEA